MAKSALHSRFKMDSSLEEEGVWVNFGEGAKIRVRRLKSKKSQEVRKELDRPYTNEIRRGGLPEDVASDLLFKQIAGGVISAWEGVTVGDAFPNSDNPGDVLVYNPENALALLKELPELTDEILGISLNKDSFKLAEDDDAVKNS